MNKYKLFKASSIGLLSLSLAFGAFFTSTVSAQSTAVSSCVNLTYNMRYGARDAYTNGDVSRLQNFLNINGLLSVSATGYFGPMTLAAVQKFQTQNNLYSAGYVGPLTRASISTLSCGSGQTFVPVIYSANPTSGAVGNAVTLSGANFTSDTTVSFGSGFASAVVVSSNQITFTVPEYIAPACYYTNPPCLLFAAPTRVIAPGNYSVTVSNSKGTSNAVNFNVISTSINNRPVISGLDAPTTLNVGQQGTWSVRATDVTGGGLSYSVEWGDEMRIGTTASANAALTATYSQTSTFTHTYNTPGTYTPFFTIRGSNGQSAQISANVTVIGPSITQAPMISSIYPTSGPIGTLVTIYGSGFTTGSNLYGTSGGSVSTNTVLFAGGPINGVATNGTSTLYFNVPSSVGADCPANGQANVMCPMSIRLITPGTNTVLVRNQNGVSNAVVFTVTSN